MIAAASASGVVDHRWAPRLAPRALCIDVGIGNYTAQFITTAHELGHTVVRLDVRSAGDPLPRHPNPFFTHAAGERQVADVTMVAGGLIGQRGHMVVDNVSEPTQVIGVADGVGGLLPEGTLSTEFRSGLARLRGLIASGDPAVKQHSRRES